MNYINIYEQVQLLENKSSNTMERKSITSMLPLLTEIHHSLENQLIDPLNGIKCFAKVVILIINSININADQEQIDKINVALNSLFEGYDEPLINWAINETIGDYYCIQDEISKAMSIYQNGYSLLEASQKSDKLVQAKINALKRMLCILDSLPSSDELSSDKAVISNELELLTGIKANAP